MSRVERDAALLFEFVEETTVIVEAIIAESVPAICIIVNKRDDREATIVYNNLRVRLRGIIARYQLILSEAFDMIQ